MRKTIITSKRGLYTLNPDFAIDEPNWKPKKTYNASAFENWYYEATITRLMIQTMYHLVYNPGTDPDCGMLWWYDTLYWLWRDKMEDAAEKESPYMAKVVNSILADAEQGSCAYTDYEDACDEKHFDTNHLLPNQTIEEYKDEAYNTYIDYLKRVQSQLDKAVNNYNIFVDIFYKPQHRHNERYGYAPKR